MWGTGMDRGYEAFCMADPWFYDAMHSADTAGAAFATADRSLPPGWTRSEQDDWLSFGAGTELPMQGWKIHAAARLDDAEEVLNRIWDYCVARGISFKFLRSPAALMVRVSKYAPRDSSGKLATIYPANDAECEQILNELGNELAEYQSPYILSDLRWGNGPLYVRYGGFAMRHCVDDDGQIVPAIENGEGSLVPDRREPVFSVPPWVTLPGFLEPHLATRNSVTLADLPYAIERVLHFSNGGGIYVGRDTRSGTQVVLKEARPHSGLDALGHDAVQRLEIEHDTLQQLAGVPGIPTVYDIFWVGEHRFCVMEYVEGEPLSKAIVHRYPLIDPSAGSERYAEFTDWALDVHKQVSRTLDAIHERGFVYGDLHLFNIMVRDDGQIALLDFEVAASVTDAQAPALGNQGFAAPPGTTGVAVDEYALACLQIALFLPLTTLLWLHRGKVRDFAQIIADHFPIPAGYLDDTVEMISPSPVAPLSRAPHYGEPATERDGSNLLWTSEWPELRDLLARAVNGSATPGRTDRLFPGDVEQFAVGGTGLAYGAAGVLYALTATGVPYQPEGTDWLIRRIASTDAQLRPGFFDGLHGIAYVLDHLGYRQLALDAVDQCLKSPWEELPIDLASGISGVGLNLLHFADRTGEPALRLVAHRAAELVAERLRDEDLTSGEPAISGGDQPNAGLLRGSSGPALLLIRAYHDTGDARFLNQAAEALRQDLHRCVARPNGALEVNEGWRTMPYLDVGSVGIGLVLDEYLRHKHDDQFAEASAQIQRAAESDLYILPGLFSGRAGILLYLTTRARAHGIDPRTDENVIRQLRALAWHALPYRGGIAFPGTGLLRLSMDLATGTAGVLLAVGSVLHDEPVFAPLLAPGFPSLHAPVPTGTGTTP